MQKWMMSLHHTIFFNIPDPGYYTVEYNYMLTKKMYASVKFIENYKEEKKKEILDNNLTCKNIRCFSE